MEIIYASLQPYILNQGAFTKYTEIAKKLTDTIIVGKVLKMVVTNSSLVDGNILLSFIPHMSFHTGNKINQ
jgi:hypothetical protein